MGWWLVDFGSVVKMFLAIHLGEELPLAGGIKPWLATDKCIPFVSLTSHMLNRLHLSNHKIGEIAVKRRCIHMTSNSQSVNILVFRPQNLGFESSSG